MDRLVDKAARGDVGLRRPKPDLLGYVEVGGWKVIVCCCAHRDHLILSVVLAEDKMPHEYPVFVITGR